MGRKKQIGGDKVQHVQKFKPFCYYCDRTFEDLTVLVQHQRGRHFRCLECGDVKGKCESLQGLVIHSCKVHGKPLTKVPNAIKGRDDPSDNIHGMEGVPEEILREKGMLPPAKSEEKAAEPAKEAAPAAEEPQQGAQRGAGRPTTMTPSIPPMPTALPTIAGLLPGLALPTPGLGFPGAAPTGVPQVSPPGAPQDFLDFLNKAARPPMPMALGSIGGQMPVMPAGFPGIPPLTGLGGLPGGVPGALGPVGANGLVQAGMPLGVNVVKRPLEGFSAEDLSADAKRARGPDSFAAPDGFGPPRS
eukprot:TRINITY_DN36379_c0_g1_i1.p1 TRINITY_DN36379_c0_g1~~TRINITY_DN36379_c0_g1_i1.p1  ORF type:complete len:302 (-),score=56.58 TRINITY_DN36379_c0_g1_i1:208-1113(-)